MAANLPPKKCTEIAQAPEKNLNDLLAGLHFSGSSQHLTPSRNLILYVFIAGSHRVVITLALLIADVDQRSWPSAFYLLSHSKDIPES